MTLLHIGSITLGDNLSESTFQLFHVGLLTKTGVTSMLSVTITVLLGTFFLGEGGTTSITSCLVTVAGIRRNVCSLGDGIAGRHPVLRSESIDMSSTGIHLVSLDPRTFDSLGNTISILNQTRNCCTCYILEISFSCSTLGTTQTKIRNFTHCCLWNHTSSSGSGSESRSTGTGPTIDSCRSSRRSWNDRRPWNNLMSHTPSSTELHTN
mmetsp:Transcript_3975/g.8834  ORF Transcript_3975/g.8834 Transcript_3975/m.8834 type:complete len:209 (+) Transcript_3975:999-1625(+)